MSTGWYPPDDQWSAVSATGWTLLGADSDADTADLLADQPGRMVVAGRGVDAYYQVIAGTNDKITFDEGGGTLTATLTPGLYSGATMATEVKTQMEAVGGLTYTVTLAASLTWQINGSGSFSLLWDSGTAGVAKCARMLGWDVATTASSPTQLADRAAVGNYLALLVDCGSSVTASAVMMQVAASAEGTPDYDGVRVFSAVSSLGGSLAAWEAGPSSEHDLSARTVDDAPLQVGFHPLAVPVGARYWWAGWVWDDDCLTHALCLARMWEPADLLYSSGRSIDADVRMGPADSGNPMTYTDAYPAPGGIAWQHDLMATGWPVADYASVLLAVQRITPRRCCLVVLDVEEAQDGNDTTWATLQGYGVIVWGSTTVEPARVRGCSTSYRDAAIRVRQVR